MANIIADIHKWDTWHLNIGLKRELDYFFQVWRRHELQMPISVSFYYTFFMIARKIILANGQRHIFNFCAKTFGSEKLDISILECVTEFEDDVKWYSIDCNVEIASRMGVLGKQSELYQLYIIEFQAVWSSAIIATIISLCHIIRNFIHAQYKASTY